MINTLIFVTGNDNKLHEASLYLQNHIIEKTDIKISEVQDTDVYNVIKAKLKSAFWQLQKPCFVMDASLIIDGLCNQDTDKRNFPWALIKDVFNSMGPNNITTLASHNNNFNCTWTAVLWYYDGLQEYYFSE